MKDYERAKQLARALKCHPSGLVFPGWAGMKRSGWLFNRTGAKGTGRINTLNWPRPLCPVSFVLDLRCSKLELSLNKEKLWEGLTMNKPGRNLPDNSPPILQSK